MSKTFINKFERLNKLINSLEHDEERMDELKREFLPTLNGLDKDILELSDEIKKDVDEIRKELDSKFKVSELHGVTGVSGTNFVIRVNTSVILRDLKWLKERL